MVTQSIRPGIYNVEYFSGAQVAVYIGSIFVDELTSIQYSVSQTRKPIYGYASRLYDDLSEGNVLVQGQFTINYKEAGYMWLILNKYKTLQGEADAIDSILSDDLEYLKSPFGGSENKDYISRQNVEQIVNGETSTFERNRALLRLAQNEGNLTAKDLAFVDEERQRVSASLGGYASNRRRAARRTDIGKISSAESIFERFEDKIWQTSSDALSNANRRCDDPILNPFDMFITAGDFAGSDYDNHTMRRLIDVSIIGMSQVTNDDGTPISETYIFIARDVV